MCVLLSFDGEIKMYILNKRGFRKSSQFLADISLHCGNSIQSRPIVTMDVNRQPYVPNRSVSIPVISSDLHQRSTTKLGMVTHMEEARVSGGQPRPHFNQGGPHRSSILGVPLLMLMRLDIERLKSAQHDNLCAGGA